jgi:hypothetical protein
MFAPDPAAPAAPAVLRPIVGQMVTQLMECRAITGAVDLADLARYGWDAETIASARPHLVPDLVAAIVAEVMPAAADAAIAEAMAHDIADATRRHGAWDWALLGAYGPHADRLYARALAIADRLLAEPVRREVAACLVAFGLPFAVGAVVEIVDRLTM